jgi:hypothetical protein
MRINHFGSVLLFIIALMVLTGSVQGISQGDTCTLVIDDVLKGNTEGMWVYTYPDQVKAGTTIDTWYGDIILPESDGWLFFIDDAPMENWAHPCRYVFIDMSGTITIKDAFGPPLDLVKWNKVAGSAEPPMFPIQEPSRSYINALPPCTNPAHCYAVIISGGADPYNNWERYYGDVSFIYKTLVNDYGYLDDHIIVLMSDGTSTGLDQHKNDGTYVDSNPDLDGDGDDDIGYSATKANIATVFNDLQTRLGTGDHLFIFTTDHGGPEDTPQVGTEVIINLWYETIRDDQFADEVDKITSTVPIMITMEQCYSGGIIDDVIPGLPGQERVIATAANAYETSHGDVFSTLWISAVAGHDKSGSPVDADVDNDGKVSLKEAFDYAKAHDGASEHPQYDETPAGIGSTLALSSCYMPALPVANAGTDQTVEQTGLAGTSVTLDGTGSSDPCGEVLTYSWTWAGGSATGPGPTASFPLGTTVVSLVVAADGRISEPDTVSITVQDTTKPELIVPSDVTVEQATRDGTVVQLVATATDICDADVDITDNAPDIFPLGSTIVTFTATDNSGNTRSKTVTVTVVDTTPPVISVTMMPDTLWPPNHKMVDIEATVSASDICDAAPDIKLTGITSDEPDNGLGDGDKPDDIQAAINTFVLTFKLRSERSGEYDGRVYTITYTATDDSGNSASASDTVVVPLEK